MSIRLLIFGTSDFGIPSFEKLRTDSRFSIVAVVTQPAKPTGRHQILTDTPVGVWAKKNDLQILTPKSLKTDEVIGQLRELNAVLFVVASYGLILPQIALDIPTHGCLNIHASLLPKYRGASPISAAILNGDTTTGITFMKMDVGCDTGPILSQITVPIAPDDTRISLEQKLSTSAASSIVSIVVELIDGQLKVRTQPSDGITLAPRLARADGKAVWDDANKLERQIRAHQPWPGLWTTWNKSEIKILSAIVNNEAAEKPSGTIIEQPSGWGIVCRHGILCPQMVQFAGKKPQPAKIIPGSYPGFIGSQLD